MIMDLVHPACAAYDNIPRLLETLRCQTPTPHLEAPPLSPFLDRRP